MIKFEKIMKNNNKCLNFAELLLKFNLKLMPVTFFPKLKFCSTLVHSVRKSAVLLNPISVSKFQILRFFHLT